MDAEARGRFTRHGSLKKETLETDHLGRSPAETFLKYHDYHDCHGHYHSMTV